MPDDKAQICYSLASSIEKIDCALHDIKTGVLGGKPMRGFNGMSMSLYALQGAAKGIGKAMPEVATTANKLARRAHDISEIVQAVGNKPVPKVISEFVRDDLKPLWDHQKELERAASKRCGIPSYGGDANEAGPKFEPIPAEVKKAAAKVRKQIDAEVAKRQREYQNWSKGLSKRVKMRAASGLRKRKLGK